MNRVTLLYGLTTHQQLAGLPKWQTKLLPRLLASFFRPWPCVNARRSALPSVAHYVGSQNLLADTASWAFSTFHHGKARGLLSHSFRQTISNRVQLRLFSLSNFKEMPLWQVVTPSTKMSSLVISTLCGTRLPLQLAVWTTWHTQRIGEIGLRGVEGSTSTPS